MKYESLWSKTTVKTAQKWNLLLESNWKKYNTYKEPWLPYRYQLFGTWPRLVRDPSYNVHKRAYLLLSVDKFRIDFRNFRIPNTGQQIQTVN